MTHAKTPQLSLRGLAAPVRLELTTLRLLHHIAFALFDLDFTDLAGCSSANFSAELLLVYSRMLYLLS